MKASEKKGIIILLIIAIVIIAIMIGVKSQNVKKNSRDNVQGGTGSQPQGNEEFVSINEEGEKVNTSEKVNTNKDEGEFALSNVSLKEAKGETIISARITNKSGRKQESFLGNIVLVDKSNKEIGKIPVRVSDMENGETVEVEATITESYVNAYDYRLEK